MTLFKTYINRHWKFLIIPITAMIGCICVDSTYPYLQKIFVDNIILGDMKEDLFIFIIILIVLSLTQGVLGYLKEYLFDKFALIVCKKVRQDLYLKFPFLTATILANYFLE